MLPKLIKQYLFGFGLYSKMGPNRFFANNKNLKEIIVSFEKDGRRVDKNWACFEKIK